MMDGTLIDTKTLPRDLTAAVVVFLVALPLCLGIALASGAPLLSGIVAGVVGGLVVAWVSGSHTSISGPAAGLTAIVAAQIEALGSFEAFLVAVALAGLLQIGLGVLRAGSLAAFFPSSVIKGLLAAIGIILILKQIPHLFGHDPDWLGDMSFRQIDGENTFSELLATVFHVHAGATVIGLASIALMLAWDRTPLRRSPVPSALVVVAVGVAMTFGFAELGPLWQVGQGHLVQVPVSDSVGGFVAALPFPDWAALTDPAIVVATITIAIVASLETLLNVEAIDKLDPKKRSTPLDRELVAQGVGNVTCGLVGGLPVTSVIVRSSVGIDAGGQTRMTAFVHGLMLLVMVLWLPGLLNHIPLSALAAVLMVTGFKLAHPDVFRKMAREGYSQFVPFVSTITAIVLTDLLVGILIGMAVAVVFILQSNLRAPLRQVVEHHAGGDVLRIELANQVSFLNRAHLLETLHAVPPRTQLVLDARGTVYIDPDIADLLDEFETEIAPAHEIAVSLVGFEEHNDVEDRVHYAEFTTREIQDRVAPEDVIALLRAGNARFAAGQSIRRDLIRQVGGTADAQHPLAVVLGCMDSRVANELIFDTGIGDVLSVRVAGHVPSPEAIGSIEYGCAVAGAKVVVVLGHTGCEVVAAAIEAVALGDAARPPAGCANWPTVLAAIAEAVHAETGTTSDRTASNRAFVRRVIERHVRRTVGELLARSPALRSLVRDGRVALVGGLYDLETAHVQLLDAADADQPRDLPPTLAPPG